MTAARGPVRWVLAGMLALLLAVATATALAGAWARALLYDTDAYVAAVGPLVDDPAVQQAIADQVSTQVAQSVQDRLGQLPPLLQEVLAGPADRLVEAIDGTVSDVVTTDEFADAWVAANRSAHEQIAGELTGTDGGAALSVENGEIAIQAQVFVEAGKQGLDAAGLGAVADLLPEVDGRFVVLQSDSLGALQAAVRALDAVGAWMWLVAVVLAVAVVVAAPRPRRGAMVAAGAVLVGAGGLAVMLWLTRTAYLGSTGLLPTPAKEAILDRLLAPLWSDLLLVATVAAVVLLLAWAAGFVRRGEGRGGRASA